MIAIDALIRTNRELGEHCERLEQASEDHAAMSAAWLLLAAAFPAITEMESPVEAAQFLINTFNQKTT